MASYQSTFSPPTRPGTNMGTKRLGAYISPSNSSTKTETSGRFGYRGTDIAQASGEMDAPRGKFNGRATNLPKPSGRVPSPAPVTEAKGKSIPSFSFRRLAAIPSATTGTPALKNKHSRNVLKRKPSSIAQNAALSAPKSFGADPAISSNNLGSVDTSPGMDKISDEYSRQPTIPDVENLAPIIPELDRYRSVRSPQGHMHYRLRADIPHKLATQDLPPPTILSSGVSGHNRYSGYSGNSGNSGYSGYSGYSASPSTRYSESPGPGAYSRDTTPTSISSQSPGIIASVRMTPRLRQNSPTTSRLPPTRRRTGSIPNEVEPRTLDAQGLPSLRESLTSSSSNSTVRGVEKGGQSPNDKKKRLSPLPPSPPPRKSSQNFKKSRSTEDEEVASPSKAPLAPTRPVMSAAADGSPMKSPGIASPHLASTRVAPLRPSRDGAPDLQTQFEESMMVIRSNLPGIHHLRDRRESGSLQSIIDNKSLTREATPVPSGLGIVPDLRLTISQEQRQRQSPGLRTPSPNTTAPKHRFGLFGRRTKTAQELALEQKDRPPRKGPAAGTGHEGYGRYALRGRSDSVVGRDRSFSIASSSLESVSSSRTHDPFLLERMSPVIIAGGGEIVENRNASLELSRTDSGQSLQSVNPSLVSKLRGPGLSTSRHEPTRTTLWPSAMPRSPVANGSTTSIVSKGSYLSSESDNDIMKKPTLAFRRSMHRLRLNDQESLALPRPIRIVAGSPSPATSLDTSLISDDNRHETNQSTTSQKGSQPKKLSKRPRSPRKWNFFQRSQTSTKPKSQPKAILPVVIAQGQVHSKSIPYYAMIDYSEQEGNDVMDIEDILREADVVDLSKVENLSAPDDRHIDSPWQPVEALGSFPNMPPPDNNGTKSQVHNAKAVKLLKVDIGPSEYSSRRPEGDDCGSLLKPLSTNISCAKDQVPGCHSRLPQVGRIPHVVTAKPQQTSSKSFSRPFARISIFQPLPNHCIIDQESIALGPSPEWSPSPPQTQEQAVEPLSDILPTGLVHSGAQGNAFLVMSPRKNSEATTSSSSFAMSFAGTTAVIPEPGAALEVDEVWDEYDDLIGDESLKAPGSGTSPRSAFILCGEPESRPAVGIGKGHPESSDAGGGDGTKVASRLELTSSSVYSPDLSANIKNALSGLPTPTTPYSFTDLFDIYGDQNNSLITRCLSYSHSHRDSGSLSVRSIPECPGEIPRRSTDSRLGSIANESPTAQVNLRVGSMTVSKWLTFGHVLFSPARENIPFSEESKHHSVLVIDGLGNDDWSFYAAETYPSANFYNLSPTPSLTGVSPTRTASYPQAPGNHRQVQYQSNLDKYPFPRDTFTTVVLRFPAICSDAAIRNLISESKRVLKPAGYLEMSILDLDMMNMGNRTRRAIRSLKVRLTVADPSFSLAPTSDTVLRIIGKRGFEDIKSCNVGVPVASTVRGGNSPKASPGEEKDISLADMMKDESDVGDAGITKMVAKVGRWWFLRCYEMAVLPDGDTSKSLLSDTALLKECEKWNTSFKLLVCHAQKPVAPHRQTASV